MPFNLSAALTLNTKNFDKGLKGASKSYNKFNANMKKAGAQAANVGQGLRSVGMLGAASAGGILYAVKAHLDFERQLDSVAAKMKGGKQHYVELESVAKRMGASTIFTAKQAAEGLEYLALAGFDAKDSIGVLPSILYTAGAGALELGRASDIITDSMSAMAPVMKKYGDRSKQATTLADMMALAQARSNTNIEQLGEAIKFAGGSMANLGIPLEEIIGSMGALADAGLKGSMGGTPLVNMLNKLAKPTSKAKSLMDKMGMSMSELKTPDGKLKSMADIITTFEKHLGANFVDKLDKAGAVSELFGIRGQRAFFALANKGGPALKALTAEIKGATDATDKNGKVIGASKKMYDDMTNNLYGAWEAFKSAVSGMRLGIGKMISTSWDLKGFLQAVTTPIMKLAFAFEAVRIPAEKWSSTQKSIMQSPLGAIAKGATDAFVTMKNALSSLWVMGKKFFSTFSGGGKTLEKIVYYLTLTAAALAVIGPPLLALGAAMFFITPIVTGAVSAIGLLGTVVTLLLSPITLAVVAVAALGYALYQMMGGWNGVKEAVSTFGAGFMESFGPAWTLIKEALLPALTELKAAFGTLFTSIFGNTSKAKNDFTSFGYVVGKIAGAIGLVLTIPIKIIAKLFTWIAKLQTIGVGLFKGVLGFLGVGKGKEIEPAASGKGVLGDIQKGAPTEEAALGNNVIPFPSDATRAEVTTGGATRAEEISNTYLESKKETAAAGAVNTGNMTQQITAALQNQTQAPVNVVVNNTVDEDGLNSMVKKSERHAQNKLGNVQDTSQEAESLKRWRQANTF